MSFTNVIAGLGTGSAAASQTTITLPGAAHSAGEFIVIGYCGNVAGMTFSVSDNSTQSGAANVWKTVAVVGAAVLSGGTAYCFLTRNILSTDTITITITGGPCSRTATSGSKWTCSNNNPQLDTSAAIKANATTSPVTTSLTGTLAASNELGAQFHFWKGAGVASGYAQSSPAGWSGLTGGVSSGASVSVETNHSAKANIGSTTSFSGAATYTSITAAAAQILTFTDNPVAAFAVPVARSASQSYDQPRRYPAILSRVAGIFDNNAPPSIVAPIIARSVPYLKGPASFVVSPTDPAYNTFSDWVPGHAMGRQGRQVDLYKPPLSRFIPAGSSPVAGGTDFAPSVVERQVAFYRGSYSYNASAADQSIDSHVPPLVSRPVPYLTGPRSQALSVYFSAPVAPDAWTAAFQNPQRPPLLTRSLVISPQDPAGATYMDWAPTSLVGRVTPFYLSPRSLLVSPIDPAGATYADWAPTALLSRLVPFYTSPRAFFAPPQDPAYNTFANWTPPVLLSRAIPYYTAPRSLVIQPPDNPGAITYGTDYVATVMARMVPYYRGSYSLNVGAGDQSIDSYASLATAGRAIPYYSPPRSFVLVGGDQPIGDWTPGMITSRAVAAYLAPRSLVISVSGVGAVVTPDTWAQVFQGRQGASYASTRSLALILIDPAGDNQDWVPGHTMGRQGRQVAYYQAPPSQFIPARDSAAVAPDTWSAVFASRQADFYYGRRPLSVVYSPSITTLQAQGWAPVFMSRGSFASALRASLAILPLGEGAITPGLSGGGGEWIIWTRPDFPANRRGAWNNNFPPPNFRKPTRRVP